MVARPMIYIFRKKKKSLKSQFQSPQLWALQVPGPREQSVRGHGVGASRYRGLGTSLGEFLPQGQAGLENTFQKKCVI